VFDFAEFKSGFAGNGQQYLVGRASFSQLLEWSKDDRIGIILSIEPRFEIGEIGVQEAQELVA
jgi:hypothetical protein